MPSDVRRGVFWSYASTIMGVVFQVGVTATTARLLEPAAFGLMAMATVVLRLGGYVAQLGIGRALIQRESVQAVDVRAAFTSSALLGVLMFGIVFGSAPLIAVYFQAAELVPVLRVLGLWFVVSGMGSTAQALLTKSMRFRESAIIELVSYGGGYTAVTLVLAATGFEVWSLVGGMLAQAVVTTVLSYGWTRHPLAPTLSGAAHARLLGFGSKLSVLTLLEYAGSSLDTLLLGRMGTTAQLGLYNRALMLANLPTYQVSQGLARVLFPALSRVQGDGDEFRTTLLRMTEASIKTGFPVGVGLAMAAPEVVRVALGERWLEVTPVFAALSLGFSVRWLATMPGIALEAVARLRSKTVVQSAYIVLLLISLALTISWYPGELLPIAVVLSAASGLRTLGYFALATTYRAYEARGLMALTVQAVWSVVLAGTLIGGALSLARYLGLPPVVCLAVAIGAGAAVLLVLFRRDAKTFLAALSRRIGRAVA